MSNTTRRELLAGSAILATAGGFPAKGNAMARMDSIRGGFDPERLMADVEAFAALGPHRSATEGNRRATDWMAGRLGDLGYSVERHGFTIAHFEPQAALIVLKDGQEIPGFPQWPLPAEGSEITAPLARLEIGAPTVGMAGAIAIIELPYARWSSYQHKAILARVEAAAKAGARASVLITHGPTGELIALNALPDGRLPIPVIVSAPKTSGQLLAAAARREPATFRLAFKGPMKGFAENVVARRNAGATGKWIIVTTPLSGWFTCATERGPGIAIFLALAEWLAKAAPGARLLFTANSGHELENLGAEKLLDEIAPRPDEVALWVHLGAGIASLDVHEGFAAPLPSADPQRYLMASPSLLEIARRAFKGQPGLEAPYPAGDGAAGELKHFIEAGYDPVIGALAATRWHHTMIDTPEKTSGPLIAAAAEGFREVIADTIAKL